MSSQWHGGKGSSPRPMDVSQEEFAVKWDNVFKKNVPKEKNDFQDILSTEDCVLDALDKILKK